MLDNLYVSTPTADISVRIAWSADAAGIAAVQVQAWRHTYTGVLPVEVLDTFDADDFAAGWAVALDKPKDARNRVLVALERVSIRGFAVTGPSPDPDADSVTDGQIGELAVDPAAAGRGHGSRLLQACADTLRSDRFNRAMIWVNSTDDRLRSFVTAAGWSPDGASRELDLHGDGRVRVKQLRLHTDLRQD